MSKLRSWHDYLILGLMALAFAACSTQKEPAREALDAIDETLDAVSIDASKYVPGQLASIRQRQVALRGAFDSADYSTVLSDAPAVLDAARTLATVTSEKRALALRILSNDWVTLTGTVPHMISAVREHLDGLSLAQQAPKGANLSAAQLDLADASTQWDKAQAASVDGSVEDAVRAAQEAKDRAAAAASALRMKLPESD